jgi:hypothetical protein
MVNVGTPASIAKSTPPTTQELFDLTKMATGGGGRPGAGRRRGLRHGRSVRPQGLIVRDADRRRLPERQGPQVAIAKLLLATL